MIVLLLEVAILLGLAVGGFYLGKLVLWPSVSAFRQVRDIGHYSWVVFLLFVILMPLRFLYFTDTGMRLSDPGDLIFSLLVMPIQLVLYQAVWAMVECGLLARLIMKNPGAMSLASVYSRERKRGAVLWMQTGRFLVLRIMLPRLYGAARRSRGQAVKSTRS